MFRALEPPGTFPERSGTAQDHLKAPKTPPRRPKMPPRRPKTPPRRPRPRKIDPKWSKNQMKINPKPGHIIKAPKSNKVLFS